MNLAVNLTTPLELMNLAEKKRFMDGEKVFMVWIFVPPMINYWISLTIDTSSG